MSHPVDRLCCLTAELRKLPVRVALFLNSSNFDFCHAVSSLPYRISSIPHLYIYSFHRMPTRGRLFGLTLLLSLLPDSAQRGR